MEKGGNDPARVVPLVHWTKGPSPINLGALKRLLEDYPRLQDRKYLWQGFLEGFRISFQGKWHLYRSPNLPSVKGMEEVVMQKIKKECSEGRVLGPFCELPVPNLRISPLGVVPKKAAGEFRLIHHLSYPHGESGNDAIPADLCTVRYMSFNQALGVVRHCRWAAELEKP